MFKFSLLLLILATVSVRADDHYCGPRKDFIDACYSKRDQTQIGNCALFGATPLFEHAILRQHGQIEKLSEADLFLRLTLALPQSFLWTRLTSFITRSKPPSEMEIDLVGTVPLPVTFSYIKSGLATDKTMPYQPVASNYRSFRSQLFSEIMALRALYQSGQAAKTAAQYLKGIKQYPPSAQWLMTLLDISPSQLAKNSDELSVYFNAQIAEIIWKYVYVTSDRANETSTKIIGMPSQATLDQIHADRARTSWLMQGFVPVSLRTENEGPKKIGEILKYNLCNMNRPVEVAIKRPRHNNARHALVVIGYPLGSDYLPLTLNSWGIGNKEVLLKDLSQIINIAYVVAPKDRDYKEQLSGRVKTK